MKIKTVHIKNFRSIKNETLEFPDNGLVSLIWPNNAWKSNFLRAIDLVLWEGWNNGEKLEDYDYYAWDRKNIITISILFDNWKKVIFDSSKKWPEYFNSSGSPIYGTQWNVKDDFPCTYLSAERSITKDMSFSKWSLMGKISKSFNKAITPIQKEQLQKHFEGVKTVFNWVDSFSGFEKDFKDFFSEMQSDSPYKLNVDFKPFTPNNYFKTINILAKDPNLPWDIDLEQLGDGAKNLAVISLLRSYAKNFRDANGIIAIEEPEIYLHPQARKHLFEVLKDIAKSGLQVIFTTHDPNFLDIWNFESIQRVYKVNDTEIVGRKFSKLKTVKYKELLSVSDVTWWPKNNSVEKVKHHYQTISNFRITEGFFSSMIILVEWPTEELTVPYYFDSTEFSFNSKGISILWVGWKWEIPKYWRLFHSFWIPVICLFDNDNSKNKAISNWVIADCFWKTIADIVDNIQLYKEIEISEWKLVILEWDFECVIKNEFLKQLPDQSLCYDKYLSEACESASSKQMRSLLIAKELFNNHNFVPSFILALKNTTLTWMQITPTNYNEIPF